jgi:hypothetical protein
MASRTMAAVLLLLMLGALVRVRRWRAHAAPWFDESALLAALLLGGGLLKLA